MASGESARNVSVRGPDIWDQFFHGSPDMFFFHGSHDRAVLRRVLLNLFDVTETIIQMFIYSVFARWYGGFC